MKPVMNLSVVCLTLSVTDVQLLIIPAAVTVI